MRDRIQQEPTDKRQPQTAEICSNKKGYSPSRMNIKATPWLTWDASRGERSA